MYYALKVTVTALLVVLISEISKRSSFAGAVLASIPIVSVLAMVWLYLDTKNIEKIVALSNSIFWLVLPSLALFVSLPILLKLGVHFYWSLVLSIVITIICYWAMIALLELAGVRL